MRYLKPDGVLVQTIGDDLVVMNIATEQYFSLSGSARRFWECILTSGSVSASAEQLMQEYEVEQRVLEQDLEAFCAELVKRGLLERPIA